MDLVPRLRSSTSVHVQHSSDDGASWTRVGDPIVGQGRTTGASTFNNDNQVFVSRSHDGGVTWQASRVFTGPPGDILNNVFPSLAVDPVTSAVYATWSDRAHVWVAKSTDHGATWGSPVAVSSSPLNTAIFPWIAALNGLVDVTYYGTTSTSKDSPTAVWNVYLAQSVSGGPYTQTLLSPHPNHVGPICTNGIACAPGTRNLLDLFEIALTTSGNAGIIYTDDTLTTSGGSPLPQAVLAMQN